MMPMNGVGPSLIDPAPIGIVTGAGWPSRRSLTSSRTLAKLAPTTSILLTKTMRGTAYLSACRQTVSDWASTPFWASKTTTAPSRTRRLRSTSAVKSTWPGVSMRLTVQSRQDERNAGTVDGDAAILLFLVVIGFRGPLVDAAQLVLGARVKQNVLRGGRLAGIDVGDDADVTHLGEFEFSHVRGPINVGPVCKRPCDWPATNRSHKSSRIIIGDDARLFQRLATMVGLKRTL